MSDIFVEHLPCPAEASGPQKIDRVKAIQTQCTEAKKLHLLSDDEITQLVNHCDSKRVLAFVTQLVKSGQELDRAINSLHGEAKSKAIADRATIFAQFDGPALRIDFRPSTLQHLTRSLTQGNPPK